MHNKEASLGLFLGSMAAGEVAMRGLQRLGRSASNDLLSIGIDQGKRGLQMNPLVATQFKNYLGKKQYEPYAAGQAIGERMQKMDDATQKRFLAKLKGLAKARNERLDGEFRVEQAHWRAAPYTKEPKRVQNTLLNSVANLKESEKGKLHNFLASKPIPAQQKTPVQNLTGNLLSAPAAYFDHRIVARPVLRGLENLKGYNKVIDSTKNKSSAVAKSYDALRNWYD